MLKDTASGQQENTKRASCIVRAGVTERVWGADSSATKRSKPNLPVEFACCFDIPGISHFLFSHPMVEPFPSREHESEATFPGDFYLAFGQQAFQQLPFYSQQMRFRTNKNQQFYFHKGRKHLWRLGFAWIQSALQQRG